MKKQIICILMIGIFLLVNCQKKNTTEPPGNNNIHPQVDIPWPSLADSPWPMFHHDPQSTGRSPYIGPQTGKIKWQYNPNGAIHSAMTIGADSTLYFVSFEKPDVIYSLYAVSLSGQLKWKITLPFGPESQPLITDNGTIIVVGDEIYLIDPEGTLQHTIDIPGRPSPFINIGADGILYLLGEDRKFFAVSQAGNVIWSKTTDFGFSAYYSVISPDGNTIYLYSYENEQYDLVLNAVAAQDGEILWKYRIGQSETYSAPTVASDGNIYLGVFGFSDSSGLYSIKPTGHGDWFYAASIHNELTIDYNGNLYFDECYYDMSLTAIDYRGNIRWSKTTQPVLTSLVSDKQGTVYICGSDFVSAISSNGELMWQIELEGYATRISPPAIGADGCLYFGTYAGEFSRLYCIY